MKRDLWEFQKYLHSAKVLIYNLCFFKNYFLRSHKDDCSAVGISFTTLKLSISSMSVVLASTCRLHFCKET
ncbi:hypothetical protein Bhyg_07011 [Pseudolycoriella hygida]|uniref:Uncharacterized protein n=1 Tax=Pseudolycoriella hygida TaxID=35572 RepID=A0A9Q0N1S1_9DIPT|nr:hypothetical protein Bhyg_07011 [Pseudolycoriella hygida]